MTKMILEEVLRREFSKEIKQCDNKELLQGLMIVVRKQLKEKEYHTGHKKLYYISAEFLIGKLLANNLINLGIYDEVRDILQEHGKSLTQIEETELEPSLGNGGLGRLAACFLDSIATLGLRGDGVGLNYHFGLFQQNFEDNLQKESKNPWIESQSWLNETNRRYEVKFGKRSVRSKLYDVDVVGYHNGTNRLHLFDIESVDESLVKEGITFDKEDVSRNLTLFLYPDDSDKAGNLLRIYQQYFMVSNAAQLILDELQDSGYAIQELDKHVVIQINDTHPSMVIPELIRILVERSISMDEAIRIVSNTCAYTNHTILAEALEKWPLEYLQEVVPQLVPIIQELNKRAKLKHPNPELAIIDKQERVHMARMDMHYGFSINGVAALHTEILKHTELKAFYDIYPGKFNNKTNGITFRRWLLYANPQLRDSLSEWIGEGYKKDANELEKLLQYKEDDVVLEKLLRIKADNKLALKQYLKKYQKVEIDENSIFDIQIKRLHEYKRQQMNALYIIYKYLEIKKGNLPETPITMIFGAKAAPAYIIAKDIIHLILCLQELIDKDEEVNPYLKIVMVENYNVTLAEKLIPACDVSEQISLASKEASGTGNMKFMLNGAVTLGTDDGANVEIHELVGNDNIYIFGESSEQVVAHYEKEDYVSLQYYLKDDLIQELIDFMVSRKMLQIGSSVHLLRLHQELLVKDWFMTFLDIRDYIVTKERAFHDYTDRRAWSQKMLVNTAKAGFFSSDRTIEQYNQDIWHLS